jgi:Sec-independent protein translocase protein TatA
MSIGVTEIAMVTAGLAVTLWFLPKALPELGRSLRLFHEELKRK